MKRAVVASPARERWRVEIEESAAAVARAIRSRVEADEPVDMSWVAAVRVLGEQSFDGIACIPDVLEGEDYPRALAFKRPPVLGGRTTPPAPLPPPADEVKFDPDTMESEFRQPVRRRGEA